MIILLLEFLMKKEYVKPTLMEIKLEVCEMIASSGYAMIDFGDDVNSATTDSNKRRGSWGNRWE